MAPSFACTEMLEATGSLLAGSACFVQPVNESKRQKQTNPTKTCILDFMDGLREIAQRFFRRSRDRPSSKCDPATQGRKFPTVPDRDTTSRGNIRRRSQASGSNSGTFPE